MQQNALTTTFAKLRQANIARLPLFKNKHGEPAHSQPDGSDWTDAEWLQAVIGELGEYANVRKKLQRGDYTQAKALPMMADELADVSTYLDILAFRLDIDLSAALTLRHRPGWAEYLTFSDAAWVQEIVAGLGHYAELQRSAEYPDDETIWQLAFALAHVVHCINELAAQQGIDLCDAIVDKFNRVSERVDCDVKL